jgi:hypothetical protein
MNSRGRRSHSPVPGDAPQLLWWLGMIAAALVGGLAAARLGHASLLVAVIVSVVLGVVFAMVPWPGPPRELPAAERESAGFSPPRRTLAPPGAGSTRPIRPVDPTGPAGSRNEWDGLTQRGMPAENESPGQTESVVQLLPLPSGPPGNTPWYEAAQGAPPPPSRGAQRAPAPDLSTYLASTFIAQCPRCGAFGLDYRQQKDGLGFRCKSCEYAWTWQPGTPWPPVRVMPARRRESRPPSP